MTMVQNINHIRKIGIHLLNIIIKIIKNLLKMIIKGFSVSKRRLDFFFIQTGGKTYGFLFSQLSTAISNSALDEKILAFQHPFQFIVEPETVSNNCKYALS